MQVIFLTYVNRSGSTFLANLLSNSPEIFACPEGDWLVMNLLEKPMAEFKDPEKLKDAFAGDIKLVNWQLTPEDLLAVRPGVRNIDAFYRVMEIMLTRKKPEAVHVVFKSERLAFLFRRLHACHEYGGEFKYIYIMRDPRAVYNSQKQTINPLTGRPYSGSPAVTALYWKKHTRILAGNKHTSVFLVKYEDMINDLSGVKNGLADYLGLTFRDFDPGMGDLVNTMPDDHRSIHRNISRPPLKDRPEAWEKTLASEEIREVELVAAKAMERNGYTKRSEGKIFSPALILKAASALSIRGISVLASKIKHRLQFR